MILQFRVWTPPATRVFPCPIPGIGSGACVGPAYLMRRIEGCRWPVRRCACRIQTGRPRSEAPRNCPSFPDPISTAVCPCTALGFPAPPAAPAPALVSGAEAQPRIQLLLHYHKQVSIVPHLRSGMSRIGFAACNPRARLGQEFYFLRFGSGWYGHTRQIRRCRDLDWLELRPAGRRGKIWRTFPDWQPGTIRARSRRARDSFLNRNVVTEKRTPLRPLPPGIIHDPARKRYAAPETAPVWVA